MNKEKNLGFTLIEILVATTIIAVLTAIAVVSFTTAQKRSRDGKRRADLETIRAALEMRRVDTGVYQPNPLDLTVEEPYKVPPNDPDGVIYMQKKPIDPRPTLYKYVYTAPAGLSPLSYDICAYLESGGTGCTGACCADCSVAAGDIPCNYSVSQP